MAGKTIFVAGAGGLIGAEVTRELRDHGYQVLGLVRGPQAAEKVRALGAEPIHGDLSVAGDWQARALESHALVDASQARLPSRLTIAGAKAAAAERIRFTTNLLAVASRKAGQLESYIAMSGLEDYEPTSEREFNESTPIAAHPRGYGRIGLAVRPLLLKALKEFDLPLVQLRMGLVYGGGGWFRNYAERLRRGRLAIVGSGSNYNSLVSAADVALATRLSIERRPVGKSFLVVDDEPVMQQTWVAELARLLGRPSPRLKVPRWVANWAVGRVNVETFASSRRGQNSRVKQELEFALRFPTFRSGFADYLRQMK